MSGEHYYIGGEWYPTVPEIVCSNIVDDVSLRSIPSIDFTFLVLEQLDEASDFSTKHELSTVDSVSKQIRFEQTTVFASQMQLTHMSGYSFHYHSPGIIIRARIAHNVSTEGVDCSLIRIRIETYGTLAREENRARISGKKRLVVFPNLAQAVSRSDSIMCS